jgi:diguanylate cyclase (GGDEF)-like protein
VRGMWVYLVVGAVAIAASFTLPDSWWQTGAFTGVSLLGVAGIVIGVRVHRPRRTGPWWLLAVGVTFQVIGDLTFAILNDPERFPTWSDAAYLGGWPMIAIGIALMIRARSGGRDRAGGIDALIVASSLGLLSWVFLISPTTGGGTGLTTLAQVVAVAYPISDIVLLTLVVRMLIGAGARVPALRLLAAAAGPWLVADTVYAVLLQHGSVGWDGPLYGIWLVGFLAFGATAMHPSMVELTEPAVEAAKRLTRPRLAALSAVSLIAPVLLIGQTVRGGQRVEGVAIGIASTVLFLLVVMRMVGLLRQVEDQAGQLAVLARRDGLTGVLNRRAWDAELPVAMDRARRDGLPLSVALIDLDHFKRFNDEHGHQAGDRLLTSATAAWATTLRTVDVLCRYGGEEFGVLLPGTTAEQAVEVLDRLRGVTPLGQTFSAGVACWNGQEISDDVLGRVDRALYVAKDTGRDRVVIDRGLPADRAADLARELRIG